MLFRSVEPLRLRAEALVRVLDRVLGDAGLLDFHLHSNYPEIARLWRQSLLTEDELAVLPEIGGWGAALAWSYEGLQAVHEHIAAVTSRPETLTEVIASMALADQVEMLPAGLAVAVGDDAYAAINAAFEQRQNGFDTTEWLQENRGWIARGLLAGAEIGRAHV